MLHYLIVLLILLFNLSELNGYCVYLPEAFNYPGSLLYDVKLANHHHKLNLNHHQYIYNLQLVDAHNLNIKLNTSKWITFNQANGLIYLKKVLKCESSSLSDLSSRPFKLIIEANLFSLNGPIKRTIQLLRYPLEIYFEHSSCLPLLDYKLNKNQTKFNFHKLIKNFNNLISLFSNNLINCDICSSEFKKQLSEQVQLSVNHLALIQHVFTEQSDFYLNYKKLNCLHKSQFITNLKQLIPQYFLNNCKVNFEIKNEYLDLNLNELKLVEKPINQMNNIDKLKFIIQTNSNDLISLKNQCTDKDNFNISLAILLDCNELGKNEFKLNTLPLNIQQIIDVTLTSNSVVSLDMQSLNQFINKRKHELNGKLNKVKYKQDDTGFLLIFDSNYLFDSIQRSKRELKSNRQISSLYFDRNLYIVNVLEEIDKGYNVITLTAKNQHSNQQIIYSINAILDARSQSMFKIDELTGSITTTVKLDREFMNVHYFKVIATELLSIQNSDSILNQTNLVPKSAQITLQINVLDINDNAPVFEKLNYEATISEFQPINSIVITVRATDLDTGSNAELEYSIGHISVCSSVNLEETSFNFSNSKSTKDLKETFKLNAKSGVISTKIQLDRELINCYNLVLQVNDLAQFDQRKSSQANLIIKVQDENDNYPQFSNRSYSVFVFEDINFNEKPVIIQIKATDEDENLNSALRYSIISGNQRNHFSINTLNGEIYVVKQLDYEELRSYRFIVCAQDTGSPPKSNITQLLINLIDVNDNSPVFYNSLIQETVLENTKENTNIIKVQAFDSDDGDNAKIFYTIKYNNEIFNEDLYLQLYNKLVHHKKKTIDIDFQNDESYLSSDQVSYNQNKFNSLNKKSLPFRIDNETGWLISTKILDYEEQSVYEFNVIARDFGVPFRESSISILIHIEDINDNNPIFTQKNYELTISELTKIGTELLKLSATDLDEKSRFFYSIVNGNIQNKFNLINKQMTNEALLTVMSNLDYKIAKNYQLTIQVTDSGGRTDYANVLINITDANTHTPVIEKIIPDRMPIPLSEDSNLNSVVAIVEASDGDTGDNAKLIFSILYNNNQNILNNNNKFNEKNKDDYETNLNSSLIKNNHVIKSSEFPFKIDSNTGVITLIRKLDRELVSGYNFIVNVMDSGNPPLSDTVNLEFEILDVNDNKPEFSQNSYNVIINELAPIGTSLQTNIQATDIDQGINAQIRYSIFDATLDFMRSKEALSGLNISNLFNLNNYNLNFNNNVQQSNNQHFVIDPVSGIIRTNKILDRETQAIHYFIVQATDKGTPQLFNSALVTIVLEDANDNPPRFNTEKYVFYIAENSPLNSLVGKIKAEDSDEGNNAIITYEIVSGLDAIDFKLIERKQENACEIITNVELDFESNKKVFNLIIRASSLPLRNDVEVEIYVTDVNDNIPHINDFTIVFNNYKNHFPLGVIGKAPGYDIDISDILKYRFVSGNRANLLILNETTGQLTLSPYLNTNVPTKAQFEIAVTDGLNEASAQLNLIVNLVTEQMLQNSITLRLNAVTQNEFFYSVYTTFVDGISSIFHCNKDNIVVFNIQEDLDNLALNISFSIRQENDFDIFYSPNILRETIYLSRSILTESTGFKILPFDDNICVYEPCINYEQCNAISKFKFANDFVYTKNFLFRSIVAVDTFACSCPSGYTGFYYRLDCDTELNLCHSFPCLNSGKCIQTENSYTCVCEAGFTGINCELNLEENLDDICNQSNICKSGSKCISLAQKRSVNKRNSNFDHYLNTIQDNQTIENLLTLSNTEKANTINAIANSVDNLYCMNCLNSEWSNDFCELKARSFIKGSYLTFDTIKDRHRFQISLRFSTIQKQGLLLYNGRFNEQNDFIGLEYLENNLIFSYSIGSISSKIIIQTLPGYLNNGKWHKVDLFYLNRTVLLKLDDCNDALLKKHLISLNYIYSINPFTHQNKDINQFPKSSSKYLKFTCANFSHLKLDDVCSDKLANCQRFLDLTGPLQLGGLPKLETKFQVSVQDFEGCISDVYINSKMLDLNNYVYNNNTNIGCEAKKKFCKLNLCKNGGQCREIWNNYVCNCKNDFTGKNCEIKNQNNQIRSFQGSNAYILFTPNILPISLPWKIQLSFKTIQQNCFIVQIQLGLTSQIAFFIKNGSFNILFNRERFQISSLIVNNGDWVHINTIWSYSNLLINFNYGELVLNKQLNNDLHGLIVTKVLLGKFEELSETLLSGDTLLSVDTLNDTGLIFLNHDDSESSTEINNLLLNEDIRIKFNLKEPITIGTLTSLPNFVGCIQLFELNGNHEAWLNPSEANNVNNNCTYKNACLFNTCGPNSKCINHDLGKHTCQCKSKSYFSSSCESICDLKPCENNSKCVLNENNLNGYECLCNKNFTGQNCEIKIGKQLVCPLNWWKTYEEFSCTPCECDSKLGLNASCDKINGKCECEINHFESDLQIIFKLFLMKYIRNIKKDVNNKIGYNKVGKLRFYNENLLKNYLKSDHFTENSFADIDVNLQISKLIETLSNSELFRRNLVRSVFTELTDKQTNLNKIEDAKITEINFEPILNDFLFNDYLYNYLIKQKMDLIRLNKVCMNCDCNSLGSYSQNCSQITGQCNCKPGVIGRKCDQCASSLAEITSNGCEVIYDKCPTQYSEKIWWPKTKFNQFVTVNCPENSIGLAKRYCSEEYGWLEADLFTCISSEFKELAEQLTVLEKNNLPLTTYLSIKIASELKSVFSINKILYGGDILISGKLVFYLIKNEFNKTGLNLTHKQDQHFLQNIITIISEIFNTKYEKQWEKINNLETLKNELVLTDLKKNSLYDTNTNQKDLSKLDETEDYINDESSFYNNNNAKNELIKRVMKLSIDKNNELEININAEKLLNSLVKYSRILLLNQEDTFTAPFQILSKNLIFALDTVSTDELWNIHNLPNLLKQTTDKQINKKNLNVKLDNFSFNTLFNTETGLQSLSLPLDEFNLTNWKLINHKILNSVYLNEINNDFNVVLPKYNNFIKPTIESDVFKRVMIKDSTTKILIPIKNLNVFSLKQYYNNYLNDKLSLSRKESNKAIVVYSIYNSIGKLLQMKFDHTVKSRFGVPIKVNSPLITVQVKPAINNNLQKDQIEKKIFFKIHFVFKILQQNSYSNPQCAYFNLNPSSLSSKSNDLFAFKLHNILNSIIVQSNHQLDESNELLSKGVWSTEGCQLTAIYPQQAFTNVINYVNCTCEKGFIFAVLMDQSETKFYFETSNIFSYIITIVNIISLFFILFTILSLIFVLSEHQKTNCNSIHINISICAFISNLLFLISTLYRNNLLQFEFQCKLMAIFLHYVFLCAFCWLLVYSIHLQRMFTELRDINKGSMHFYYLIGYAVSAFITAISLAMRSDQYGNYIFCWLSVHEAIFWSMLGPIIFFSFSSILNFILALKSTFQIKNSITDYNNLRTLLWLNIFWLPLLSLNWFLAVFAANNTMETPFFLITFSNLVNAIYLFIGYCLMNTRVRLNLRILILKLQNKSISDESLNQTKTSVLMNSKNYLSGQLSSPVKTYDVEQQFSKTNKSNTLKFNKQYDISNFDSSTTTTTSRSTSGKNRAHYCRKSSNNNLMNTENYIDPYGNINYDNDEDYEDELNNYNNVNLSYSSSTLDRLDNNKKHNKNRKHYHTNRTRKRTNKIYSDIREPKNLDYTTYKNINIDSSINLPSSSSFNQSKINNLSPNYDIYQMPSQIYNVLPYNQLLNQNIYSNSVEIEAQMLNQLQSNQDNSNFSSNNNQLTNVPYQRENIFAMMNTNYTNSQVDSPEKLESNNYVQINELNNVDLNNRLRLVDYSMNLEENPNTIYVKSNNIINTQKINNQVNEIIENI